MTENRVSEIANALERRTGQELAMMRMADVQADHTARLARIETLLTDLARRLLSDGAP